MWLASWCLLSARNSACADNQGLFFSLHVGCWGFLMEWLSSKSKCPERSRWKPYYLLWFSLGSTITTSAVAINLPKFKGWEHRFHLSIRSVSKSYCKKRIWNGSCRDGKLRKYNLSHCLFFNGDLPELLVSFVVGHSYSLSSLDGADSW